MTYKTYEVQVHDNGARHWYQNGKLHRDEGPAIEYANGTKEWYQNGMLHREDGPAIEFASGNKQWYQNGRLHREDGPAVYNADETVYWYLDGVHYTKEDFLKKTRPVKELTVAEIEDLLGYPIKIIRE